jgi:hypothetical protein
MAGVAVRLKLPDAGAGRAGAGFRFKFVELKKAFAWHEWSALTLTAATPTLSPEI